MKKILIVIITLSLLGISSISHASSHQSRHKNAGKKGSSVTRRIFNSKGPIHIISQRLDADNKKRIITFSGKVVAKRSNLTLTCRKLIVSYTPKGGEISRITASGNVVITQPPRSATCDTAIFFQKSNKVILIGNPVLSEGKNKVSGSKVTFFLNSDKTIIEGGKKGRVRTTIVPKSQAIPFKAKP